MSRGTRTSPESLALLLIPRGEERFLDEALALAETAGYRIARVVRIRSARRIGPGTLERIRGEAEKAEAGTIIVYGEPPPSTLYILQKDTGRRVIDRVMLILEIFLLHAGSREAKLQIEAAMIKHRIPILREYVRRAKMGEDPGFLGPGEYAIDRYRASLERKLVRIRRELESIRRGRRARLEKRKASGMIHASIVGYASAGKTSLFNAITGETKPVGEEYFTTLHPKHKAVPFNGERIVFVDTVGFIRRVPPEIIEAFHSTLEEIVYSDAIVFVVDSSETREDIEDKLSAGVDVLTRLGVLALEDRLVIAANKIDLVEPGSLAERISYIGKVVGDLVGRVPIIPVSARTGYGVERLVEEVYRVARKAASLGPLL